MTMVAIVTIIAFLNFILRLRPITLQPSKSTGDAQSSNFRTPAKSENSGCWLVGLGLVCILGFS